MNTPPTSQNAELGMQQDAVTGSSLTTKAPTNIWEHQVATECTTDQDELWDRVDDAIEDALLAHESMANDSRCSCGGVNNMDGDVLHSHRLGAVSQAVRDVLGELHCEQRTLADGMGGMSTNWKTGETTVHSKPCTRQVRWVTQWERDGAPRRRGNQ